MTPLIEDHVHSLGQVVHGAIGCHSWVPLITEPEGEAHGQRREALEEKGTHSDHRVVGKQDKASSLMLSDT